MSKAPPMTDLEKALANYPLNKVVGFSTSGTTSTGGKYAVKISYGKEGKDKSSLSFSLSYTLSAKKTPDQKPFKEEVSGTLAYDGTQFGATTIAKAKLNGIAWGLLTAKIKPKGIPTTTIMLSPPLPKMKGLTCLFFGVSVKYTGGKPEKKPSWELHYNVKGKSTKIAEGTWPEDK